MWGLRMVRMYVLFMQRASPPTRSVFASTMHMYIGILNTSTFQSTICNNALIYPIDYHLQIGILNIEALEECWLCVNSHFYRWIYSSRPLMSDFRQFYSKTTTFGKSTKTRQHLQLLSTSRTMLTSSRIHTSPNFSPSSPLKKFPELLKVRESMGTSRCHINLYEKVHDNDPTPILNSLYSANLP